MSETEEAEVEEKEEEEKIESIYISSIAEPILEITDKDDFEIDIGLNLGIQVGIQIRKLIARLVLLIAVFGAFIWTPLVFVFFLLFDAITVRMLLSIWSVPFILITSLTALHTVLPSVFK